VVELPQRLEPFELPFEVVDARGTLVEFGFEPAALAFETGDFAVATGLFARLAARLVELALVVGYLVVLLGDGLLQALDV